MENHIKILAINPGSTSTKIALFHNNEAVYKATIRHSPEELNSFGEIQNQLNYRKELIEKTMIQNGHDIGEIDVYAARGGGLVSVESGVYEITNLMAEHSSIPKSGAPHPAQLAPQIAKKFADKYGKPAYVVNPPDVDEFIDIARVTGIKGINRESHVHALNQKEIALRFCKSRGIKYGEVNLIVCHIGGGTSITAHEKGKMIDSNDIIKGTGPMTGTRAGEIAYMKIVDMAYNGDYTKKELTDKLNKNGGLTDHFGSADIREAISRADGGDEYARLIINGMIYQNAKCVGAMAVALKGKVEAIILTGGISKSNMFTDRLAKYVDWIAEVVVMPGEFELEALASGALRVMRGEEEAKTYTGIPVWNETKQQK